MDRQKSQINLIPDYGPDTGNYWCSWDTQFRLNSAEDGKDTVNLRNVLTQEFLFAENGVLNNYFHSIRKDLYIILDDGWDVPPGTPGNGEVSVFGSLELNEEKFPNFTGTPEERLYKMKKAVIELGYRGLGLWICANATGESEKTPLSLKQSEDYWKEKAILSRKAGIDYWKVDWGYHCMAPAYRDMMTRVVKQYASDLKIEHASCRGPLDRNEGNEIYPEELLSFSDYIRTYDIVKEFTYSTTISRTWALLQTVYRKKYGCAGIVNVEDALLLGAGLGCSMGVMRHPCWGGTQTDVLEFGLKYNEVERVLHWQRIAPPFGAMETINRASGENLIDWTNSVDGPEADGWLANMIQPEEIIKQSAPYIITRNMERPVVTPWEDEKPFLACSRHPMTGAVSLAVMPRTLGEQKIYTPRADITMRLASFTKPIGIFGEFGKLTIPLEEAVSGRIYLQDLCREAAVDVTELVKKGDIELEIDFDLIRKNGWLDNDRGDLSAPGFMLCQLEK
ncbi:hypothetical protein [Anaerocolumna sp. MB42-C2]|uniref:hypothetical protein n=1 Tax=Anaerocolumna sp. MB42-C2 TaxID=3070997 RepID=UPI0027DF5161|nr:hypothetical protein [Anaerocolumna sp. MB42-C2]WMJ88987.1 hypothetical protein RBU59_05555 [Anaerocolumna sp. MB42-C2]